MIEPTRRMVLLAAMGVGMAAEKEMLAWDFGFPSIEDGRLDFAAFRGRVLLVTNTATFEPRIDRVGSRQYRTDSERQMQRIPRVRYISTS